MDKKNAIAATGRRKCASARVRIDAGSGKIVVNGQKFEEYFETEALRGYVMQPLNVTGYTDSNWYEVTYDGKVGYIAGSLVKE